MKETIAQEAYRLLKDIPEDEWITDEFTDKKSKCCAIGHYIRLKSNDQNDYSFNNCTDFNREFLRAESRRFFGYYSIADINNYAFSEYQQDTPKQRVLALLQDMIDSGY